MTENHTQTPADKQSEESENKPNWLQRQVNKRPRAAKFVAIAGGVLAVGGTAHFARTLRANKPHLDSAAGNVGEALGDLSAAVTPNGPDA